MNSSTLAIRGTLIWAVTAVHVKVAGSKISADVLVVNSTGVDGVAVHASDVAVRPPATSTSPEGSVAIPGNSRAVFIGLLGAQYGVPAGGVGPSES